MPETAYDDLQPQLTASQPRVPGRIEQIFVRRGQQFRLQSGADGPAGLRCRRGVPVGVTAIHLGRAVIDLGEFGWRGAVPHGGEPAYLLLLELAVVRDRGQRGPAGRVSRFLSDRAAG